jgi:sulfur relay (sulfurtransferase) DsrC/TusE family protein
MVLPHHESFESFCLDTDFLHEVGVDEWNENLTYWTDEHNKVKTNVKHKVVLKYDDYAQKLESKLMERLTVQYMNYELSQGTHPNKTLQQLYDKVEAVKLKKSKTWFLTVSFDDEKFNENNLHDLSKAMNKLQSSTWLTSESNFSWQIEQRNNCDDEGYRGFHIHATFSSSMCKSRMIDSISRGVLGKYIQGREYVDLRRDNGNVTVNYLGTPKKDIKKLLKQVKDQELQRRCSGSLVVELRSEDLDRINEYRKQLKAGHN